jgi:hypothetical protein
MLLAMQLLREPALSDTFSDHASLNVKFCQVDDNAPAEMQT